jgi:hypothetical protein
MVFFLSLFEDILFSFWSPRNGNHPQGLVSLATLEVQVGRPLLAGSRRILHFPKLVTRISLPVNSLLVNDGIGLTCTLNFVLGTE